MANITIAIPENILVKVQDLADKYQISLEDLLRATVEELVADPEGSFVAEVEYILDRNSALYKRLA